jgi:hypothetical protein
MRLDVYHPLVGSDHDAECAALCTDYDPEDPDGVDGRGCTFEPRCWCPVGALSYTAFWAKHPKGKACLQESDCRRLGLIPLGMGQPRVGSQG